MGEIDKVRALADTSGLPDYGGKKVVGTTISIRNAGDGLSEGVAVDPVVYPIGSTQFVVLETVVQAHDHKSSKDSSEILLLDQVLKAGVGIVVDADLVQSMIDEQRDRIAKAKDAAAGRLTIPFLDGDAQGGDKAGDDGEPPAGDVNELGTRRKAKAATAKKAAAPKADAEPKGDE